MLKRNTIRKQWNTIWSKRKCRKNNNTHLGLPLPRHLRVDHILLLTRPQNAEEKYNMKTIKYNIIEEKCIKDINTHLGLPLPGHFLEVHILLLTRYKLKKYEDHILLLTRSQYKLNRNTRPSILCVTHKMAKKPLHYSEGPLCLYIIHLKVDMWPGVTDPWLTDSRTTTCSVTQLAWN